MTVKDFFGIIRAPFLLLAVVCVFLGFGTAYQSGVDISIINVILVFLGGIFAHISVNVLNEYFDFVTGLDFKTIKTPFSGGSGTLINKPHLSKHALLIGVISSLIVVIIGLYFIHLRGTIMLLFGLLGILIVVLYPIVGVKNTFISLISPGIGFGTVMILGTHYALSGSLSNAAIISSFVPFFLVNNLLLLNQLPDMDADKENGRSNFVIKFGKRNAVLLYILFNILAYITVGYGIFTKNFNNLAMLGLFTVIFAFISSFKALKYHSEIPRLIPALAMNVLVNLITPLILGISFLIKI